MKYNKAIPYGDKCGVLINSYGDKCGVLINSMGRNEVVHLFFYRLFLLPTRLRRVFLRPPSIFGKLQSLLFSSYVTAFESDDFPLFRLKNVFIPSIPIMTTPDTIPAIEALLNFVVIII